MATHTIEKVEQAWTGESANSIQMAVSGKMPNSPTFEATILQTINCLIIFSLFLLNAKHKL